MSVCLSVFVITRVRAYVVCACVVSACVCGVCVRAYVVCACVVSACVCGVCVCGVCVRGTHTHTHTHTTTTQNSSAAKHKVGRRRKARKPTREWPDESSDSDDPVPRYTSLSEDEDEEMSEDDSASDSSSDLEDDRSDDDDQLLHGVCGEPYIGADTNPYECLVGKYIVKVFLTADDEEQLYTGLIKHFDQKKKKVPYLLSCGRV